MTWLDDLVKYAHNQVDEAREAYWERGVSNDQIEMFKLGFLSKTLPPLEGADEFIRWCHGGKKLDNVFVFPLTTPLGEVRGVQFRAVDRTRTGYMDFIVDKAQPVLFGLSQAMDSVWSTGRIWLVEGTFDLFPVQRVKPNVVSTLTARVPDNFVATLRRMVGEIYFLYDMDPTGRKGSARFKKQHEEFRVEIPTYSGVLLNGKPVKDPNNLWEALGDDGLLDYLRCIEPTN